MECRAGASAGLLECRGNLCGKVRLGAVQALTALHVEEQPHRNPQTTKCVKIGFAGAADRKAEPTAKTSKAVEYA